MNLRGVFRGLLAVAFVVAGLNHFRRPDFYLAMIPPGLPSPAALNFISGAAEILGGIGVLVPATRRLAGWGLIALLVAVFPANVHMALAGLRPPGVEIATWVLWARLPLQAVFIAWVWWTTLARPVGTEPSRTLRR